MIEHQFNDYAPLSGTRVTLDGYLVGDVRCARVGCQLYNASDFGTTGNGDGTITVYRPEEVVFAKDSLSTFAGKPVTMGHPVVPVTSANWKDLAVGDIGTDIARDGEFVRVPYKVMDAGAVKEIQDGTREVSMGYTTNIEIRDGVAPDGTRYQAVQTGPIRINHLAIVPKARGGSSLRIGDAASNWGSAPIPTPRGVIGMPDIVLTSVVLGDKAVQVPASEAPAIEAFKDAMKKSLADAKSEHDAQIAAKDATIAAKDAENVKLKSQIIDALALDKLVSDRAKLIGDAKKIKADVVTDGKTSADIKASALGDLATGKSEAYIDAMFDILANDADADPVKKALKDSKPVPKALDRETAYAARDEALSSAWKTKKEAV